MKKKIMVFCDSYLPAYQSGGAMHMIVNLIDRFCDRYDFLVATRNYDSPADKRPFSSVKTNEWNRTGNAMVYYFSPDRLNTSFFSELIAEVGPDAFLTNMSFSMPTIVLLRARKKGIIPNLPIVIAACGSLSSERLRFKAVKKRLFLAYARFTNLYRDVVWKASFESEKEEIKEAIGPDAKVMVAADLCPKTIAPDYDKSWKPEKRPGHMKLVFYSRIDRVKNLSYLLQRLAEVDSGSIELEIIGPHEDKEYWDECLRLIDKLGPNVRVTIVGPLRYDEAIARLAQNHFFVLPSVRENFGYVFLESMAVGSPNITSDRTVWDDIESKKAGWRIPLENPDEWVSRMKYCIDMDETEFARLSTNARNYALAWLAMPDLEEQTAGIFRHVFGDHTKKASGAAGG